ncbi:hypothetical protein E4T56_gene9188, partial [Termitomyces sp. T112]
MVEPLVSVVYNTLLSNRSKLNSVVRTVVTTPTHNGISPNFFNPEPRRVKGKNKSENVIPEAPHDRSLREWSSFNSRHLFLWPFHTHLMMLDELLRDEKTTPTRMRPKRPPRPRPRIIRPLLTSPNHAFQRRHASFATESESTSSETALPDISAFSRIERRIQRFQRIAQLPLAEVNLHHLWRTYESVKNYDMSLPSKMNFLDKYLSAAEM